MAMGILMRRCWMGRSICTSFLKRTFGQLQADRFAARYNRKRRLPLQIQDLKGFLSLVAAQQDGAVVRLLAQKDGEQWSAETIATVS